MSSFCWCIIKVSKNQGEKIFKDYTKNNICCIFDSEKNRFLEAPLPPRNVFCNIACGYDKIPIFFNKGMLNNDGQFFGYVLPKIKLHKNNKNILFEFAKNELKKRLDSFQQVVLDIYNIDSVQELTLYFTETANEVSLSEYLHMNWKINEISKKMYELINYNHGLLPAFTFELKKQ